MDELMQELIEAGIDFLGAMTDIADIVIDEFDSERQGDQSVPVLSNNNGAAKSELQVAREEKELSKRDVAGRLGVHPRTYGRYEDGTVEIPSDKKDKLRAILGVTV